MSEPRITRRRMLAAAGAAGALAVVPPVVSAEEDTYTCIRVMKEKEDEKSKPRFMIRDNVNAKAAEALNNSQSGWVCTQDPNPKPPLD